MIRSVRANRRTFEPVTFEPGFNVLLADRTRESTKRDTRNGLGKSTLLEVLHFCLGAGATGGRGLLSPDLKGWEFTVEVDLLGQAVTVTRAVDAPGVVRIEGDTSGWPIQPAGGEGQLFARDRELAVTDWTAVLGELMFGIPYGRGRAAAAGAVGPAPTFRSLISYFIRRAPEGFLTPFEHHRKQAEWDKQLQTAFLLGLAWEDVRDWQLLRERKKLLATLDQAGRAGMGPFAAGSVGELEAARIRLQRRVAAEADSLASFRVHERYRDIEVRANDLTRALQAAANDDVEDQRRLAAYRQSIADEQAPGRGDVARLYEEAGVALPGAVVRRLEDVQRFHEQVLSNRRAFLEAEVTRLERAALARDADVQRIGAERAELLQLLRTHGALDEYVRIQQLHATAVQQLRELEQRITGLRQFQQERSTLRIEQETLQQRAQHDYQARIEQRARAIALFNAYSEALYQAPGNLIIDVTPDGFRFDVEIERAASSGIGHMQVFCYDLTLASLWAGHPRSPGFLVHDSAIFDGVDERQVALALELAARAAAEHGFQYICTLNSDTVPWEEFSDGFDLNDFVRRRLTDVTEAGSLLGVRFDARRRAPRTRDRPAGGRKANKASTSR